MNVAPQFKDYIKTYSIEYIQKISNEGPIIFIAQNLDSLNHLKQIIKKFSSSQIPYKIISMDEAVSLYLKKEKLEFFSFLEFLSGIETAELMDYSSELSKQWFLKEEEDRTMYKGISLGLLSAPQMHRDIMVFFFIWIIVNNISNKFKKGILVFSAKMSKYDQVALWLFNKKFGKERILIFTTEADRATYFNLIQYISHTIRRTISFFHYIYHEINRYLFSNSNSKRILIASPSSVNYFGGTAFLKSLGTYHDFTCRVKNAAGLTRLYLKTGIIEDKKIFDNEIEISISNLSGFKEISDMVNIDQSDIYNFIINKFKTDFMRNTELVEKSLHIITRWPFHLLLSHTDLTPVERAMVLAAKKKGIPTLLVQHGISSWKLEPCFLVADYIAVWGKVSFDWFLKQNTMNTRLILTGAPRYRQVKNKYPLVRKSRKSRPIILFALSGSDLTCRYGYLTYINPGITSLIAEVEDIVKLSREMPEFDFIVKMKYEKFNRSELFLDVIKKGKGNIRLLTNNKNFKRIIRESFIVIVGVSEVGLEAMYHEVPVIRYMNLSPFTKKVWNDLFKMELRNEKDYVANGPKQFNALLTPMNKDELGKAILRLKNHPDFYKRQVQNGLKFVQSYCPKMNIEPSVAIAKEINKIVSRDRNRNNKN